MPEEKFKILILIKEFAVYYIAAHVFVFLFINIVISYLKKINLKYEHKFINQNINLKRIRDNLYNNNIKLTETVDKLQKAQSQLMQHDQMASLGILTAGITHELNNPLNFISVGIQNIDSNFSVLQDTVSKTNLIESVEIKSEYDNSVSTLNQLVDIIKTGTVRIEEIINGLKDFTQIDKGKYVLSDIHKGIDATLMLLKNNIKDKIELVKNYDNNIKEIYCFHAELNQVYMNILKNSIHAIKDKGKITITTAPISISESEKYELDNNYIKISIKDTGCGIPEKDMDSIFLPFFTTKEIGEGTGLGLSLSYGIIKKHKGKIIVNSQINKGSEFILFINAKLTP